MNRNILLWIMTIALSVGMQQAHARTIRTDMSGGSNGWTQLYPTNPPTTVPSLLPSQLQLPSGLLINPLGTTNPVAISTPAALNPTYIYVGYTGTPAVGSVSVFSPNDFPLAYYDAQTYPDYVINPGQQPGYNFSGCSFSSSVSCCPSPSDFPSPIPYYACYPAIGLDLEWWASGGAAPSEQVVFFYLGTPYPQSTTSPVFDNQIYDASGNIVTAANVATADAWEVQFNCQTQTGFPAGCTNGASLQYAGTLYTAPTGPVNVLTAPVGDPQGQTLLNEFVFSNGTLYPPPGWTAMNLTSIVMTVSASVATVGTNVTLQATVTGKAGAATPTGTVSFSSQDGLVGIAALNAAGVAVFTTDTLSPGTYTITAAYSGDANNLESTSTAQPTSVVVEYTSKANPPDFNGDGKSDILWRNTTAGDVVLWFMNGGSITSSADLGSIAAAWTIAGTGDFKGNGESDILWRNTSTGDAVIWFMNGSSITSTTDLGTIPTSWTIAGTGDFNGDGKSDILWRNTSTGDDVIWFMNGGSIASSANLGSIAAAWTIAGTGDFNGDGKSDILWHNTSTGDVVIWFISGGSIASTSDLGTIPASWTIAGTGDFNGNGKCDILWRNTSTGDVVIWFINDGSIASTSDLGTIPTYWTIAQ